VPRTRIVATLLLLSGMAWARPHLKTIKIAVTNSESNARTAYVVISFAALRKIAPDLNAGSLMVTATEAATPADDARTLQATEIPSQVDDLDGNGKADELAFELDLEALQTRIVTITYGDPGRIFRLRRIYPARTNAIFAKKIEGLGWESELDAWRIYFDPRNAIDLYGKRRDTLQLNMFASPEYVYHLESPYGRDIYKVGDALGIGAVGAWINGQLVKVARVDSRNWRIISTGPVRAVAELTYQGWTVDGKKINLRSRIVQWAGDRGFFHTIYVEGGDGMTFATGLPVKPKAPPVHSGSDSRDTWLATYGEQVVQPGPTATEEEPGMNLGLSIVFRGQASPQEDSLNHLLTFHLTDGTATWYTAAAWDREGSNNLVSIGTPPDRRQFVTVGSAAAIRTKQSFLTWVKEKDEEIAAPPEVKILSQAAEPESPPADTLSPSHKTYSQAISLLRSQMDRTAEEWEPVIRGSLAGNGVTKNAGAGFFTEADNNTGEWQPQRGFYWTGSFWTGELWKMYAFTKDEKYRRWAELWTSALVGQESSQDHDVGFLYFYSSVPGYELTRNPSYRESAFRAAARLAQLYNPRTHLIAAWGMDGDDTIVDTMMNLQILWWASKQTGDAKWKQIALDHALHTAELLIRPDGSVIQSVHYNPGDKPITLHATDLNGEPFREEIPAGAVEFTHTHQGFAADTTWSRGAAWALYGFTTAYQETGNPKLLQTAQKVADYILQNLPDDGVPWYDFNDEGVLYRNRDTSAAAIIADGLWKLSLAVKSTQQAQRYRADSELITQSLIDRYLTPTDPADSTPPGVLRHGCSTRPDDASLIYGDFYLLDDLLNLEAAHLHAQP
jgi:unsaturated chondroitin disaccharide hydrolase